MNDANNKNLLQLWYQQQATTHKINYDQSQFNIIMQLDMYLEYFNNGWFWKKLHKLPSHGFYLYGDVGRGKSMIMDTFYSFLPPKNKLRIHFHKFMQGIHKNLAQLKDLENPLKTVAKDLSKDYQIICLDEMDINDIASAMILNNLLKVLLDENLFICITSNYEPNQLYPNGLMRERFLSAVELIKIKLTILDLTGKTDYRLTHNSSNGLFLIKQNNPEEHLITMFNQINSKLIYQENEPISINSREIETIRVSKDIVWFDFEIICGDMRSQLDYLELIQHYNWFIISNLHNINDANQARRFTWLIDILYDSHCKLILQSTEGLDKIYPDYQLNPEYTRTMSRLQEMQTKEYLTSSKLKSSVISET